MVPLQAFFDSTLWVVVRLLLLVVPFLVVFGLAHVGLPRLIERLADAGNWSANGESVVLAFALGSAATLGALAGVMLAGFGLLRAGSVVLVLGGLVTGVAVERRRRTRATPQTELLAVAAGLLAVGVMVLVGPGPAVAATGLYLAAGAFGGIARAAAVSVVSHDTVGARVDD